MFTPLHYPQVYILYRLSGRRLSYPGLLIGSVIPDLEIPFILLITHEPFRDRLILHSVVGSIAFSWIIGLCILPLYKIFLKVVAGMGARKLRIDIVRYAISTSLSALVHVIIDATHHIYNPLAWPFTSMSINYLVLFGDPDYASLIMHVLSAVLTICMVSWILIRSTSLRDFIMRLCYDPVAGLGVS